VLSKKTLADLVIDDEISFRHVGLYAELKSALKKAGYAFRVLTNDRWDRALFLNLTFWGGEGDVLPSARLPADVVAHAAWHSLAARELGPTMSATAMFLGEAIASAFDLYLVGRLLGHAPRSQFLETQVPALAEAAEAAGLEDAAFEAMLGAIAADPERAFEDLRQLLFDATTALYACTDVDRAEAELARFDAHRFGALLHHYELSNWVLYARAHARDVSDDGRAAALDRDLRAARDAIDLLQRRWLG
jgi:hypothetical protein